MTCPTFASSVNAFWSAINAHQIPGRAVRVLDKVLRYSLMRGELKALIPTQKCLACLCDVSRHRISETVSWLERSCVLQVEAWDAGRGKPWKLYSLRPPTEWRVPKRAKESKQLQDLDQWLSQVSQDQAELLPPPETLNDLLLEDFVECSAPSPEQVTQTDNLRPVLGRVEVLETGEQVTQMGNTGKSMLPKRITCSGQKQAPDAEHVTQTDNMPPVPLYTRARDRSIDPNRIDKDRFIDRSIKGHEALREHVAQRLFRVIGEHERAGKMGMVWLQAVDSWPERLEELLSTVEAMQRERTLRTTAVRWLNVAVRSLK